MEELDKLLINTLFEVDFAPLFKTIESIQILFSE